MRKRTQRTALIVLAVVVWSAAILLLWRIYYIEAWGAVSSSSLDQRRYGQLRTLYEALEDYREKSGEWPPDLEAVRGRYLELWYEDNPWDRDRSPQDVVEAKRPLVGFPLLTGPHRVEYFNPPLGGQVLLRSYGHLEGTRGWDLRRDPVTMDLHVRGELLFHRVE
jgi:hypothetical protein